MLQDALYHHCWLTSGHDLHPKNTMHRCDEVTTVHTKCDHLLEQQFGSFFSVSKTINVQHK